MLIKKFILILRHKLIQKSKSNVMKANLEKLKNVNLELFYVVTIRESVVQLQGNATEKSILEAKKLVNELKFNNEMNWISAEENGFDITLTFMH